jgi:hypothetical protein
LTQDAFDDADGDGKRKFLAYHFGPGDTVRIKTFVYVKRTPAGTYEVRANVPCRVTLSGNDAPAVINTEGKAHLRLAGSRR